MAIKYEFIEGILQLHSGRAYEVLDVGAGEGLYQDALRESNYSGIDLDSSPNPRVVQGSALEMPFESNHFDLVFAVASVYLMGPKALVEVHRVLKPGGKFVLFDYRRSVLRVLSQKTGIMHSLWTPHELRGELREVSFRKVRRITHRPLTRNFYLQPISALKMFLKSSWVIFVSTK